MDDVQRYHELLLQQRTQIRHHGSIAAWMKRCWQAVPRADPHTMSLDEYEDMYSILMYEMTICWEEELNDAILSKIWRRDAASHLTLNFERFCCSIFYFVEMWVEEITHAEYERIFGHVYRNLSGVDTKQSGATSNYQQRTCKPTLESFNTTLDNEKAMEELQMNFGKSISFNAQQYYQHFGTPTTHLQAFQVALLHSQSRALMEPNDRARSDVARTGGVHPPFFDAQHRRRQARNPNNRAGDALSAEMRSNSPSCIDTPQPVSPMLARPLSSAGRVRYVLALDAKSLAASATAGAASTTSPGRSRQCGEAFVLTGRSMLPSSQIHNR